MGVLRGDDLVAGLVFHNWEPDAGIIEVSAAAIDRRWLTRRVATEAMNYTFETCDCQMVLARHSEQNTPARKIWVALGSTETRIPRLYGRETDGIIATLTKEAWAVSKFNEVRYGQQK
jgi:RimJ/RimL family protein N-acetyltransferase